MGIAEAASSGGVLEYMPKEIYPGIVINMQTLYMSWLTMAIVAIIVFAATRNIKEIPSGIQNLVEMFVEWLNGLMDNEYGRSRQTYCCTFCYYFVFISFRR
jgi:F-type H+-transporting ATPase subunit a